MEAEDKPESQAITVQATAGLQAPFSPLSQTTDEHKYVEDDALASIIEHFIVLLVSGKSCAMLC